MLRFGGYLLWFHFASDWLQNNKHSINFLYCSQLSNRPQVDKLHGMLLEHEKNLFTKSSSVLATSQVVYQPMTQRNLSIALYNNS